MNNGAMTILAGDYHRCYDLLRVRPCPSQFLSVFMLALCPLRDGQGLFCNIEFADDVRLLPRRRDPRLQVPAQSGPSVAFSYPCRFVLSRFFTQIGDNRSAEAVPSYLS